MSNGNEQDGGLILDASGVVKTYGAVRALRDASLSVRPGEVHALLGANGAGKSTLVKILTGAIRPTAGASSFAGSRAVVHSPAEARKAGTRVRLPGARADPRPRRRRQPAPDRARPSSRSWTGSPSSASPDLDLHAMVRDLPLAVLRILDLARALAVEPDVLLLDEMTAALPADLAERVLDVVGRRRETGRSVIFISHRLLEIGALCDRATVLRDGETVGVVEQMAPGAEERIVELMLGPASDAETAVHERVVSRRRGIGPATGTSTPRIELRDLSRRATSSTDVSFDLHAGRGARPRRARGAGPGRAVRRALRCAPAVRRQHPRGRRRR